CLFSIPNLKRTDPKMRPCNRRCWLLKKTNPLLTTGRRSSSSGRLRRCRTKPVQAEMGLSGRENLIRTRVANQDHSGGEMFAQNRGRFYGWIREMVIGLMLAVLGMQTASAQTTEPGSRADLFINVAANRAVTIWLTLTETPPDE